MIDSYPINAVLTDDETELVTIINGLEEQASMLEPKIEKAQQESALLFFGSLTSLGLYFLDHHPFEKMEFSALSLGLAIGGMAKIIQERNIVISIRRKNHLASRLKEELEPADLERYETRHDLEYDYDEDDDGFYYS